MLLPSLRFYDRLEDDERVSTRSLDDVGMRSERVLAQAAQAADEGERVSLLIDAPITTLYAGIHDLLPASERTPAPPPAEIDAFQKIR